ncbi:T9SS type A sorting domain-containing protein [Rhodothermus sp. AH-315-K08]|nr:T9SS type A sorting domain-containing protein [Rhodothermus sp. AH-315-K08]
MEYTLKAVFLLLAWPLSGQAQSFPGWSKTFESCQTAVALTETTDGNLVAVGVSQRAAPADAVCVVKFSEAGEILWERNVAAAGTNYFFARSIAPSRDGGVVLAGHENVLLHLDAAGDVQRQTTIPAPGSNRLIAPEIVPTSDGGFVVSGYTLNGGQFWSWGFVAEIDSSGDLEWMYDSGITSEIYGLAATSDGGVVFMGVGYSYVHGQQWGEGHRTAKKLGPNGALEWSQDLHQEPGAVVTGWGADPNFQAVQMKDGSFFTTEASYVYSFEPFGYAVSSILTQLPRDGSLASARPLASLGPMWSSPDTVLVTAATLAPGNELLLGGYVAGNIGGDRVHDGFLARFDSEGELIEELLIGEAGMDERITGVVVTAGGHVVVAGSQGACNLDTCGAMYVSVQSGILTSSEPEPSTPQPGLTLSPNYPDPFRGTTTIEFHLTEPAQVSIEIWDMLGRMTELLIHERRPMGHHEVTWDADEVSNGLYLCRITAGSHVAFEPLVVSR